jgi:hypothetical protein
VVEHQMLQEFWTKLWSIKKKDDVVWDNKLILAYGLTKIKGDEK